MKIRRVGCYFLVSIVSSVAAMDSTYDAALQSLWRQIKCKGGFHTESKQNCTMLRAPVNIPYWNYMMGVMDSSSEKEAISFFERLNWKEREGLFVVPVGKSLRYVRSHFCMLDAWDEESPQFIKNNYVLDKQLIEISGCWESLVSLSDLSEDLLIEPVTNDVALWQWIKIVAQEPGFEQNEQKLFDVYKRFAFSSPKPGLLLAFNDKAEPVGAVSAHSNEDGSLLGIFALASREGYEKAKASLVDACIEHSKNRVQDKKAKVVYLGLEAEYRDIFKKMNFIRSREMHLYRFSPQQKKEIVKDKQ